MRTYIEQFRIEISYAVGENFQNKNLRLANTNELMILKSDKNEFKFRFLPLCYKPFFNGFKTI